MSVHIPQSNNITTLPSLYAEVTSDETDPNLANNSIAFKVALPNPVTANFPIQPSCRLDPDDHTFEVLIDTCGVPAIVTDIVEGVVLAAATVVTAGGYAAIDAGFGLTTAFNAAEPVALILGTPP